MQLGENRPTALSNVRRTRASFQPAPEGGGRARLARSGKSVQIFPGSPPLAFTAAHLSAARSEQLNPPFEPISNFGTIARPVEHLDLAAAIRVSQAVSGEIVLEKLIDTLMRTAIEQAGAERGLLIRPRGVEQRIKAEATTSGDAVIVQLRDEQAGAAALPESTLHYVLRTGESVTLDDAAARSSFGEDPYIRERQTRSILCLPLINQGKLNGVVYLENNLTRSAFTPARVALLKLLASQAAISLENATLHQALLEREQQFRDYAETASDWYWETDPDHRFTPLTERVRELGRLPLTSRVGLTRWDFAEDVESQPEKWQLHRSMLDARQPFRDFIYPAVRFDGSLMYVKVSGKPRFDAKGAFLGYRGTGNDATAAVRADQAQAALSEVQAELTHLTRVTTLGELVASIAHEVNQPIAAALTNAAAALRFLRFDPPELDEVREALEWIVRDITRAGAVVQRVRNLVKKAPLPDDRVDINAVIQEIIELTRSEAMKNGVLMRTELADGLPVVRGDRVELLQVILNLVLNAVEAMTALTEGPRDLQIVTSRTESNHVLIAVLDTGPGLAPAAEKNLFKAFHTTKQNGLGLGLSICRSIVESRGGRMWASANAPRGAVFQFTLLAHSEIAT
jgi:signal transduction histidine kinase/GAF domain-containing protein